MIIAWHCFSRQGLGRLVKFSLETGRKWDKDMVTCVFGQVPNLEMDVAFVLDMHHKEIVHGLSRGRYLVGIYRAVDREGKLLPPEERMVNTVMLTNLLDESKLNVDHIIHLDYKK